MTYLLMFIGFAWAVFFFMLAVEERDRRRQWEIMDEEDFRRRLRDAVEE